MELSFLPAWPPALSQPVLVGVLLAAGLVAGELAARHGRVPRIVGYVLAGVLLGPQASGLIGADVLVTARVLVDLSIGLIVFELGLRFDAGWLRRNRWLPVSALAESAFCFGAIYAALRYLDFAPLLCALAAAIGTATSPAVVMLVAREQGAQGQLTERMLLFTAVNCVFAYLALTLLLPLLHLEHAVRWHEALLHPAYLLAVSVLTGSAACALLLGLAHWLGKREDHQFVLLIALVVATVGVARALNVPVILALVTLGVLARNLDRHHVLLPLRLGYGGQLLFVMLFVLTGASLEVGADARVALGVLAFVLARFLGKALALIAFSRLSGLRPGGAGLLSIALMPMAGLSVIMVYDTRALYPGLGGELAAMVLTAITLLALVGPLATRYALQRAGETSPEAHHG